MAKHRLIVFTEAVAGREDEYNEWYNTAHLGDVVAVPGVVGAQRFKLAAMVNGQMPTRYLAIYDIDAEHPGKVIEEIYRVSGSAAMPLSPALDMDRQAVAVFSACSERVSE